MTATTAALSTPPTPVPPNPPLTARESHYLPTLDGWRAVAIVMVLLHHACYSLRDFFGPPVERVARFGYLYGSAGVHVFFALSGLLICTRLLQERDAHPRHRLPLRAFYVRRAYRILPPLVTFLLVVGALGSVGILSIRLGQWISCLLFYANYRPGGTWTLGHFWSLAIEEHFYLTWPFLLAAAGPRRALPLTASLAVVVGAWRALDMTYLLHPGNLPPVTLRTDTMVDGLLWGAALALLLHRPKPRALLTRLLSPAVGLPLSLAALLASYLLPAPPIPFGGALMFSVHAFLLPLPLAATLLHPRAPLSRLLELRPVRWVGRLSYSLYLYQQIFLVWPGLGSPFLRPIQSFPLNFLCAFACATASYYLIEKPSVRRGYRAAARLAPRPLPSPTAPASP